MILICSLGFPPVASGFAHDPTSKRRQSAAQREAKLFASGLQTHAGMFEVGVRVVSLPQTQSIYLEVISASELLVRIHGMDGKEGAEAATWRQ